MKKCSRCYEEKPLTEFNKRGGGRLQNFCRSCQKDWYKKYYSESPKEKERLYKRNIQTRNAIEQLIKETKSVPCMDCGVSYPPYVMDFDHRDPDQKEFVISRMTNSGNITAVKKEIAKCDVVCSNCHRIRTHS